MRERELLEANVTMREQVRRENMVLPYFIKAKAEWAKRTFGEGMRTEGICRHIEKELAEIRQDPTDLMEWIDVITLAMDGYSRAGGDPERLFPMLVDKHLINMARDWPAPKSEDEPVEHIR
jgi:hypothetical protein